MFVVIISTAAALGLRTKTPLKFESVNLVHAEAKFESETSPVPAYAPKFGTTQDPLSYDLTYLLYNLYKALGCIENEASVDIDGNAMLEGTTIYTFMFGQSSLRSQYLSADTEQGLLALNMRLASPATETLSVFAMPLYQASFYLNQDLSIVQNMT